MNNANPVQAPSWHDPSVQNNFTNSQPVQTPVQPQFQQPMNTAPATPSVASAQTDYVNQFLNTQGPLNSQPNPISEQPAFSPVDITPVNISPSPDPTSQPLFSNVPSQMPSQNLASEPVFPNALNQPSAGSPMPQQVVNDTSSISSQQPVYPQQTIQDNQVQNTPVGDNTLPPLPNQPIQTEPVAEPAAQAEEESPVIGTHQLDVNVNEDYAESFSGVHQGFNLLKQPEPKQQIDIAHPPTRLVVDNDFNDAPVFDDGMGITSSSFLPSFDDNDDSSLPVSMNGDDDDGSDFDTEDDDFSKFGFSDFDPNDQFSGATEDDLAKFEAQSLEQTGGIDADWSDSSPMQTRQQQVGVLDPSQNPQQAQSPEQSFRGDLFNQPNYVNTYLDQRASLSESMHSTPANQTELSQPEPSPLQVDMQKEPAASSKESPAAKLNQLLDQEEAAEKIIMQKQDNLMKEPAKSTVEKTNVFKQINNNSSYDMPIQDGLMRQKSSSKYFLILSLVIVISVIGFLLVLLGLSLLE